MDHRLRLFDAMDSRRHDAHRAHVEGSRDQMSLRLRHPHQRDHAKGLGGPHQVLNVAVVSDGVFRVDKKEIQTRRFDGRRDLGRDVVGNASSQYGPARLELCLDGIVEHWHKSYCFTTSTGRTDDGPAD